MKLWILVFATCDFQQCRILTSVDSDKPVQPPFKLWNSKWCTVSSIRISSNIQATSKASDQTVHMRRMIWAFADCTYHIVGNLVSQLIYILHSYCLKCVDVNNGFWVLIWQLVITFGSKVEVKNTLNFVYIHSSHSTNSYFPLKKMEHDVGQKSIDQIVKK